jgi:hypothetical protein
MLLNNEPYKIQFMNLSNIKSLKIYMDVILIIIYYIMFIIPKPNN